MVKTYIVTPNYNGVKFLEKYFSSIFNQTYNNYNVIFVDNSPGDDSIGYITNNYSTEMSSGKIKLIQNPENYGFAKANNQGIEKAFEDPECEYIVCLNNDTEIKEDFLEKLVLIAEKYPKAGSIQSKMIWGQNPDLIDSVGLEYSKNGLGFNRGAYKSFKCYNTEEEILGCCAGACLYRRDALEDIKLEGEYFDEDFFAYYEDFDLALRLRWAGWSAWYCPDAIVWHYKGGTEKPLSDFTVYYNWRNYTWTIFKNLPNSFIIKNLHLIILSEISQICLNLLRRKYVIFKTKFVAYSQIRTFLNKKSKIRKEENFDELKKFFITKWRL
ncbi:glycosyltransferase family 2 protein [Methanobacterium alcaliphilum]|uniref:glycosyltransferase family 2 protein n=1 Tax=Methanobacterium alcaliphilum TaxID=392018 RepID=UPI00200A1B89|nr:glycosyltransferase family 2 protein [Methanobacterium alcaliphilum]MCK9151633.1 glycosyltransferase family 2 protein [Methanobacterium alcaliphilum]